MLRIGDFVKFTKISINMLRHYDEIDLLKPDFIDTKTSYRYYSENQIPQAYRIQLLKTMGFSLPGIKTILSHQDDETLFQQHIQMYLANKQEEMNKLQQQINLLQQTSDALMEQKNPLEYTLITKDMPKRTVDSYRGTIAAFEHEGTLWEKFTKELDPLSVKYSTPAFDAAIFYGCDPAQMIDVEIQRAVEGNYQSTDQITFKEVPGCFAAVVAYQGEYENLHFINQKVASWIHENGYTLDGEIMNIYHISPKTTQDSKEFLTEVCYPIRRREDSE